ncbi:MAG TPA: cytochrome c oxidase subunit 3 [Ilumatobacteraceae bacterium]|nr:cytochrome c oxidase subunit 3 [Ilumatobacteraceae bacterium]HRB04026.1 cytochrome c oxidase subunit 3 [Ilumatobacteraceae bacterium]
MIALPSAPAPAPRRQVFVGTAVACAAGTALMGGMLALYLRFRDVAIHTGDGTWIPANVKISLVAANIMLIAFIPICVFAQWAVYSAKRGDSPHAGLALGLTGLMGLLFINAQAYIYSQAKMPANGGTFAALFYVFTGAMTVLVVIGVVFSAVTAFRFLGGRTADREIVSAHAMYWYFLSFVFTMLWFVVYVTK